MIVSPLGHFSERCGESCCCNDTKIRERQEIDVAVNTLNL